MFVTLLLLWLIFNGRFTIEILLVGVVASAALTIMWHKLFDTHRYALVPSWKMVRHAVSYFGFLVLEIIRCNLQVLRLILHPSEEVHPQLVTFRTRLQEDSHKAILANSITLTPGTITVAAQDDVLCVHGLDASFLDGIASSDMVDRLEKMEEENHV